MANLVINGVTKETKGGSIFYYFDQVTIIVRADLNTARVLKKYTNELVYKLDYNTLDDNEGTADIETYIDLQCTQGIYFGQSNSNITFPSSLDVNIVGDTVGLNKETTQQEVLNKLNTVGIQASDSPSADAFGRWRVSEVFTQIDIKQLRDNLPLFIDQVTNGTALATFNIGSANTTLSTSNSGDYAIAQTKQRFEYQSGKSQQIFQTFFNMNPEANIIKRIGYFSSSSTANYNTLLDGFFLEASSNTHYLVSVKNGLETSRVERSNWFDPLDGTGESGLDFGTLDKNVIIEPDFEWLGVGRIRFVIVSRGLALLIHEVDFTNGSSYINPDRTWTVLDATFKGVYMASPNQPIRYEIRQTGAGSGTLNYVCATVGSEGSVNTIGKDFGYDTGTNFLNANTAGVTYAALGVRLKANSLDTIVDIIGETLLATTQDNYILQLRLNPTVAGTFTYTGVNNSSVEIAEGATANTVTGGTLLFSEYGQGASNRQDAATKGALQTALKLGSNIDGSRDEIVLCITPLSANLDIYPSINWKELL